MSTKAYHSLFLTTKVEYFLCQDHYVFYGNFEGNLCAKYYYALVGRQLGLIFPLCKKRRHWALQIDLFPREF